MTSNKIQYYTSAETWNFSQASAKIYNKKESFLKFHDDIGCLMKRIDSGEGDLEALDICCQQSLTEVRIDGFLLGREIFK